MKEQGSPKNKKPPVVVIDDSDSYRTSWKILSKKLGREFIGLSSFDEFLEKRETLPENTQIYVDFDLGEDHTHGLEVIRQISMLGFEDVHLCSGMDLSESILAPYKEFYKSIAKKEVLYI